MEDGDDDFGAAWGDEGDDGADNDAEAESNPFEEPKPPKRAPAPVNFDDGGEPDFAGWLAAQSQAKSKKPLPKGLSKTPRPTGGRAATTGSVGAKKSVVTGKPKPAPIKKVEVQKEEEEDEGWGDAWE
jgi:SCY1-like protein 1